MAHLLIKCFSKNIEKRKQPNNSIFIPNNVVFGTLKKYRFKYTYFLCQCQSHEYRKNIHLLSARYLEYVSSALIRPCSIFEIWFQYRKYLLIF